MNRTLTAALAVAFLGTTFQTQAEVTASPQPPAGQRILFDKTQHNFGEIKRNDVVDHTFFFTNSGSATLKVLEVRPGCGCTTAGAWDKEIAPGATGKIPLQFNSRGFSGPVSKPATIVFDDPVQSNVVLFLSANIWTPIEVKPPGVFFQYDLESTNIESRIVRIVGNEKEPLLLQAPIVKGGAFKVDLRTVKEGKEYHLEISTLAEKPPTATNVVIELATSSKEMPMLTITSTGLLQPGVTFSPNQILLPANPLPAELKTSVTIQGFSSLPLKISPPRFSAASVGFQLQEVQPGRAFVLSASFPAGFVFPDNQPLEVVLETSHPKFPLLRIPVLVRQKPMSPSAGSAQFQAPPGPVPTPTRSGAKPAI